MATVDPVFKTAGQKSGLEIWRIEKMQVKPLEVKLYGKFNIGDAYIVLHTTKDNKYNVHFWLGKGCSIDEGGVAAYKTVELDTSLGGRAIQHREVQEHESKLFLSYFTAAIEYLAEDTASGFKHVEKEVYSPRLLHVKGRRNIRVLQTKLSWFSMNSGDVFIVDFGPTIYVWNGTGATRVEKLKAVDVAMRINNEERGGKAKMEIIDEDAMPADFLKQMNAVAEGTPRDIQKETDDFTYEKKAKELVKLYRTSDASGTLTIDEVGSYPLKRGQLDTKDCFILDTGACAIYVWLGKDSTQKEKKAAFKNAVDFIQTKGYPNWTTVTSMLEGTETVLFKQNFIDWLNKDESAQLIKVRSPGPKVPPPKFDVTKIQQQGTRESQKLVDDGSGKVQIWVVDKFDLVPVDPKMYGHFFGGDSYVILYTYIVEKRERYVIYFWQGQASSQDEKATSALKTIELDAKLHGAAVQIRVVQNREPDHFMLIFKGKLVIHSGGRASGFKNRFEKDSYDVDGTSLFQVRGTNDFNLRAIQTVEKASSLNSNDCFVLETHGNTYIWYGKGCSGDERLMANFVAEAVSPGKEPVKITEGEEPADFWKALGGKTAYASSAALAEVIPSHPTRLFQCSNASGKFIVEEIFDFSQEDLIQEDIMILDTYDQVYVWIGKDSLPSEQKEALEMVVRYIENDPSGRNVDSTVLAQVKQGFEPTTFTCHFFSWNPDMWSFLPSYSDYINQVTTGVTTVKSELNKFDKNVKYKYEELKGGKVPPGVDVTVKEEYLSEEDFKKVFGITTHEYRALPKWKRNDLKKKFELY